MSFMNPDNGSLHEQVQRVIDAIPNRAAICSHCRIERGQLKCSRCQVCRYCCVACQKEQFSSHKSNCKKIANERKNLKDSEGVDEGLEAFGAIRLANALVVSGQRESGGNISYGQLYYREALKTYARALKIMESDFFAMSGLEDKFLLVMTALGGDSRSMTAFCMHTSSPRFVNFMPPTCDCPPEFQIGGLANNDITFQMLGLFMSMRDLADCRRDLEAFKRVNEQQGRNSSGAQAYFNNLPNSIRLSISAINHHGNGSYLKYLSENEGRLIKSRAPDLFRGQHSVGSNESVQLEFWYLLQDCFNSVPGVKEILDEFVPGNRM